MFLVPKEGSILVLEKVPEYFKIFLVPEQVPF